MNAHVYKCIMSSTYVVHVYIYTRCISIFFASCSGDVLLLEIVMRSSDVFLLEIFNSCN